MNSATETRRGRAGEVRSRYDLAPDASRVDRLLRYGVMEAAFFDLDKTIIATSSVMALGGPLLSRGSHLEAHDRARDLRATRVPAPRRRRREDGTHARGDARAHQRLGSGARERDRARDARPSDHAGDLRRSARAHRGAQARRPQDRDHLVVADRNRRADRRAPRSRRRHRDRARLDADGRYTGELEFYAYGPHKAEAIREMAVREGIDLARQLRLLRLDHRSADARARRESRRGEPGPRARARRARSRVGDDHLRTTRAPARSGAGPTEGTDDRRRQRARRGRHGRGGVPVAAPARSGRARLTPNPKRASGGADLVDDDGTQGDEHEQQQQLLHEFSFGGDRSEASQRRCRRASASSRGASWHRRAAAPANARTAG